MFILICLQYRFHVSPLNKDYFTAYNNECKFTPKTLENSDMVQLFKSGERRYFFDVTTRLKG